MKYIAYMKMAKCIQAFDIQNHRNWARERFYGIALPVEIGNIKVLPICQFVLMSIEVPIHFS